MINIEELIPLLRKGWVAMNRNGYWSWFESEPFCDECFGFWRSLGREVSLRWCCCIKPAEDWEKSLRKVDR